MVSISAKRIYTDFFCSAWFGIWPFMLENIYVIPNTRRNGLIPSGVIVSFTALIESIRENSSSTVGSEYLIFWYIYGTEEHYKAFSDQ